MSGLMLSFQGEKGHWFAVKKGTKIYSLKDKVTIPYLVDKETKLKLDPIGEKIEQKRNLQRKKDIMRWYLHFDMGSNLNEKKITETH